MRKVLLVTGGSRGIGAATSILAAQKGWAVAVNYTSNSQAADDVVAQIKKAGGEAMSVQADVANEEQVLAMFEKVRSTLGPARFGQQRWRGRCVCPLGPNEHGPVAQNV